MNPRAHFLFFRVRWTAMILFTSVIDGGVIGLCIVLLLGEVGAFVVNGNYHYHRVLCLFISLLSGVIFLCLY